MKSVPEQQRDPSLDLIRCFALFCVISVHFYLNSGYYDLSIIGVRMLIMTVLRSASMLGVSLFLMLSGYLMHHRQPTLRYYKKIHYILSIYALASICCYFAKQYFQSGSFFTGCLSDFLYELLGFHSPSYAWYVDMYIGLFLIMPFLNGMYHHWDTKERKQMLILILVVLTGIPNVVNLLSYSSEEGVQYLQYSNQQLLLFPDWWTSIYPITFYFLGAYLCEYPLKLSIGKNALAAVGAIIIIGLINYWLNYNTSFLWNTWQNEGSLFNMIQAFLVFNCLLASRRCISPLLQHILSHLSPLCFGAYLVSWIFDNYFYPHLAEMVPSVSSRFLYYPFIVPLIYICSLCLSAILNRIYYICVKLLSNLHR